MIMIIEHDLRMAWEARIFWQWLVVTWVSELIEELTSFDTVNSEVAQI